MKSLPSVSKVFQVSSLAVLLAAAAPTSSQAGPLMRLGAGLAGGLGSVAQGIGGFFRNRAAAGFPMLRGAAQMAPGILGMVSQGLAMGGQGQAANIVGIVGNGVGQMAGGGIGGGNIVNAGLSMAGNIVGASQGGGGGGGFAPPSQIPGMQGFPGVGGQGVQGINPSTLAQQNGMGNLNLNGVGAAPGMQQINGLPGLNGAPTGTNGVS